MLSSTDLLVAAIGLVCAVAAVVRGRKDFNGAKSLLAFGSGTSAAYLVLIAWAVLFDPEMLAVMLRSNPVIIVGALLYAAECNIRSLSTIFGGAATP